MWFEGTIHEKALEGFKGFLIFYLKRFVITNRCILWLIQEAQPLFQAE